MFRRKHNDESADEFITFMPASDANEVRRLVRRAFAENGREVTVFGDHVVDTHGAQYGLCNVAAACRPNTRQTRPDDADLHAIGGSPR